MRDCECAYLKDIFHPYIPQMQPILSLSLFLVWAYENNESYISTFYIIYKIHFREAVRRALLQDIFHPYSNSVQSYSDTVHHSLSVSLTHNCIHLRKCVCQEEKKKTNLQSAKHRTLRYSQCFVSFSKYKHPPPPPTTLNHTCILLVKISAPI